MIKLIKNIFWIFLFSINMIGYTQENPPIPTTVEVRPVNVMNFGAFLIDPAGGKISMDYNGLRTVLYGATLFNSGEPPAAALFDVYANPGTILNIMHDTSYELRGDNGGTITLELDSYSVNGNEVLNRSFITETISTIPNSVFIGGTLTTKNSDGTPPGNYSGTILITFVQE